MLLKLKIVLYFIFFIFFSLESFASYSYQTPILYNSFRQIGMGGAGVAITFNDHAGYVNPALLTKAKSDLKTLQISLGYNQQVRDKSEELNDLFDRDSMSTQDGIDLASSLVGNHYQLRYSISPLISYSRKGFMLGLYSAGHVNIKLLNAVQPRMESNAISDSGPVIGFAKEFNFFGKDISFGLSSKYVLRNGFGYHLNMTDFLSNDSDEFDPKFKESQSLCLDLGGYIPFDSNIGLFHFGIALSDIVLHDTVDSIEVSSRNSDVDISIPTITSFGIGYQPKLFSEGGVLGQTTFALDYKNGSSYDTWSKQLFMGVEQQLFWNRLSLRGGFSQGYSSAGIRLGLYILNVDYVYYVEELGEFASNRPLAFHMIKIGLLFN